MKFVSVRNQQTATLISEDETQVILKLENGTEKSISPATFKRWWKSAEVTPIEESEVNSEIEESPIIPESEESPESTPDAEEPTPDAPQSETPAIDPIPEKEQSAPISTDSKPSCEPHPLKQIIEDLAAEFGTEVTTATVPTFKSLKVDGKRYGAFTFNATSVTLWLNSEAIIGLTEFHKIHHILDARIKFEDTNPETIEKIKTLMKAALDFTKDKMAKKGKK